eukprot:6214776-Pleurochrysis_carterae.AAC.3
MSGYVTHARMRNLEGFRNYSTSNNQRTSEKTGVALNQEARPRRDVRNARTHAHGLGHTNGVERH